MKRVGKLTHPCEPKYGHDGFGNKLRIPKGWKLVRPGSVIRKGWRVWDIYSGWMYTDEYHSRMGHHVSGGDGSSIDEMGRWHAWIKPVKVIKRK